MTPVQESFVLLGAAPQRTPPLETPVVAMQKPHSDSGEGSAEEPVLEVPSLLKGASRAGCLNGLGHMLGLMLGNPGELEDTSCTPFPRMNSLVYYLVVGAGDRGVL